MVVNGSTTIETNCTRFYAIDNFIMRWSMQIHLVVSLSYSRSCIFIFASVWLVVGKIHVTV